MQPYTGQQKQKNGDIILGFGEKDDISRIAEEIKNSLGNSVKKRPLIQPKITISHIPVHDDINQNTIINKIRESNGWATQIQSTDLKVLFTYKHRDLLSAVLKVTPELRRIILEENNGIVVIGNCACPARDRFHVKRCSKCLTFGHDAGSCHSNEPTCGFCANNHYSKECPIKDESQLHKCSNCLLKNELNEDGSLVKHSAFVKTCPSYLKELRKTIKITDFGLGKTPQIDM